MQQNQLIITFMINNK